MDALTMWGNPMHIHHLALWTRNLEQLRSFYELYFQATSSAKYVNPDKQFESYFLAFPAGDTQLEIMRIPSITEPPLDRVAPPPGLIHVAISVGSADQVDALTARLRADGVPVIDGPRYTGDGHYESAILDPDGNRIEITV